MTTVSFPRETQDCVTEITPAFRIVMIYADAAAGRRANRFSDKLAREIENECKCTKMLWSFDVLGIVDVRNTAASIAAAADLVIFAPSEERELSPQVVEWLEMWAWLLDGTRPALVALFQNDGKCAQKIRATLRRIASQKGLEFFPHVTFDPSPDLVRADREQFAAGAQLDSNQLGRRTAAPTRATQPEGKKVGCVAGADLRGAR